MEPDTLVRLHIALWAWCGGFVCGLAFSAWRSWRWHRRASLPLAGAALGARKRRDCCEHAREQSQ